MSIDESDKRLISQIKLIGKPSIMQKGLPMEWHHYFAASAALTLLGVAGRL